MSRAYRIQLSEEVSREIVAEDEARSRLDVLEIVSPEETAGLLRAELLRRGFQEQADGTLSREQESSVVTVDPCTGEATVKVAARKDVTVKKTREATVWDDAAETRTGSESRARDALRSDLERSLERSADKLQDQACRELEKLLAELQPELAEVANAVTRAALKAKAARMGKVLDIREDERTGDLTIKVEV